MLDELLSRQDAEAIPAPHLEAIRGFLNQGWADWRALVLNAPKLAISRATTRANIVYDRITYYAEEYFDSQGIPAVRKGQMLIVSLDDGRLILRFKKFRGRKLGTSGISTQQRLEFEFQQVVLDGVAATYIVAGYLPDELGMGLDVLAIACTYDGVSSGRSTSPMMRARLRSSPFAWMLRTVRLFAARGLLPARKPKDRTYESADVDSSARITWIQRRSAREAGWHPTADALQGGERSGCDR
ncbi:hypothetical protein ATY41_12245 [Leifsonia xyli subsp. xyli]|uniref:Uncharacterized protein n=1 Tax=Leifsonia xyli subsp. xyli TaxID=59736 RepID=A0A1E2SJ97_LEIXY|nr:hypothetical protein [Leifsonia xyli]ODA89728.1 hypothetical protein ATY41_12245 [Leifsonia xyli subsp. xyli]